MTKSEKTRRFIIEQSAVIFNKKGIAGTSITDLMEATKLAKGGIYGNFNSKEEISVEVFDYLTGIVSSGAGSGRRRKEQRHVKSCSPFWTIIIIVSRQTKWAVVHFSTLARRRMTRTLISGNGLQRR